MTRIVLLNKTVSMETWSVAQAKAKFSELIALAGSHGPQSITRNGKTAAIVVSAKECARKGRAGNLADFFAASPLPGSGLELTRLSGGLRDIEL